MDLGDLKQHLQDRAQLSPEQAERAAQAALEFFQERAPQLGGLVEKAGGAEDVAKKLGGLFSR